MKNTNPTINQAPRKIIQFIRLITSSSTSQSILFGLILTTLLVFVWDIPIKKYNIEIEPFAHTNQLGVHWFAGDYNGDGTSERIRCYRGIDSKSMDLIHYDEFGNITEHYHFLKGEWTYNFVPNIFDINSDGTMELLFFTTKNDSIFFNVLNLANFELLIDHKFFNTFERKRDEYACSSKFNCFGDFDNNGTNELFFTFDAGFGLYPRGIFKMEFPSLITTSSPTGYMHLGFSSFNDFNKDGSPEIITAVSAPANANSHGNQKFTDSISYISVLNYDLSLTFDPIPMQDEFSSVQCITTKNNDSIFYALFYSRSSNASPIQLMTLNKTGKILHQKTWRNISDPESRHQGLKVINDIPYLFFNEIGYFILTPELQNLPDELIPNQNFHSIVPISFDLDKDNVNDWIYWDNKDLISIYNEISESEISFTSPIQIQISPKIFPIYKNNVFEKFMMDTGEGFFFFKYFKNPYYFLIYIIYAFLFLAITGTIHTILYFQRKNIERKWQMEKQLSELQFNAVKNQLNPHFMFNALNSVAYLINSGKKDEAYDFLTVNSRMIQRVMDDAEKVKRSLKEEIAFTKDYIKIQEHRFIDVFHSSITIHPDVDLTFEVPKMCIHTYVENAVKHGFRNTKSGGLLEIEIKPKNNGVSIFVSDNGMGRKAAAKFKDSAGNGLSIMKEFYRLFEKYHHYQISFKISDLTEKKGGTKVALHIQHAKN